MSLEWDGTLYPDQFSPTVKRELEAEFAAADAELERKSLTTRRLINLEKRTRALETHYVSKTELRKHTDTLCETIGGFVGKELNELEQRVAGTATVKDRGVWKSTEVYCAGEGATDRGSFWICKETTKSRPGSDATWRLAAKGTR